MRKFNLIFIAFAIAVLLFVSCGKEVSTSIPTSPKPVGAPLVISSIPEGASIYVDGKISGLVTPDSLTWLDIKNYTITLKKDLYRDTSFQVDITENVLKTVFIDFNANPDMLGSITFQTIPGNSKIYLNGIFTGRFTPTSIPSLVPGNYQVKFTADNSRSDSLMVTVRSGQNILASKTLVDTTIWVDYNTNTSGIFSYFYEKIAIDNNDVIWLGSLANGLVKFDGTTWTNITKENSGLASNNISTIKFGPNGHLWVCTDVGVNDFDGTTWMFYNEQSGLPVSNNVNDIAFDVDGSPIVATQDGLASFKNNTWTISRFNLNDPNTATINRFTGVDVDNSGVWWATREQNGILQWDRKDWTLFFTYVPSGSPDLDNYYKIVRTADNEVWFGHIISEVAGRLVGLSSYIDGQFDKTTYSSFYNKNVHSIKIKNGNEKWIASNIGLFRFVNYAARIRYWSGNTLLATDDIQDVAFDSKGDAWVVTLDKGIYHFKISD